MVRRKGRISQVRPAHMSLEQLERLLARRMLGVQYVRFLISQLEVK